MRRRLARAYHRWRRTIEFFRHETSLVESRPRGHYGSPLPDIASSTAHAIAAAARSVFDPLPGIELHAADQERLLRQIEQFAIEFDWPATKTSSRRFYTDQGWFNRADAFVLYAMLRLAPPKTVVEIGSGFSSALMLDARERVSAYSETSFVFIEPDPQRLHLLLKPEDASATRLITEPVQRVPLEIFAALGEDDVLFVDSSHVSRADSDVNHIVFEILPRLAPGVRVHLHDIFWPFEYPEQWFRLGRAWNEAYLLRAFLMFNTDFEVLLWPRYAAALNAAYANSALAQFDLAGAQSIWLRRRGRSPA